MTCLERLKQEHPEFNKEQIDDIVMYDCPLDYNYMGESPSYCDAGHTPYLCIDCWNKIIHCDSKGEKSMFVLTSAHDTFRHYLYDLDTLEDVLIGLTRDENESKRIASIAGNMKIGDVFHNSDIYLKCKFEEDS